MSILRRVAERMSRGVVIRRSLVVSGQREAIYVSPDAQLKYLKIGRNVFDADLVRIAECFVGPEDVVWDIGANVGTFSVAAASRTGPTGAVLAVEPDPWLCSVLDRTRDAHTRKGRRFSVLCAAVSEDFGLAQFMIAQRGRASNALESAGGRSQMGGLRFKRPVATVPVDSLLGLTAAPRFIKIDVEGAEAQVFAGMRDCLGATPRIYSEISRDHFPAIAALMKSAGYRCLDPQAVETTADDRMNYFFIHESDGAEAELDRYRASLRA